MSIVNTNVSASITQSALAKNERAMQRAMEQLSTGSKINSAKDDAAGLAMASKFTAQIKGLDMAVKNANDAISMISTAEGALEEVTSMLQRMRELAVQAANGTLTADDRTYINLEYQALKAEIMRVANNTQWNGENLLDGSAGTHGLGTRSDLSTVTFLVSGNYSQVVIGVEETPYSAAVMYDISDVLSNVRDANGETISALYSDGGIEQTRDEDVMFDAEGLQSILGVTGLKTDGGSDTTAAPPTLYSVSSFTQELGIDMLFNDGKTVSNARAERNFTAGDLLQVLGTGMTDLYSDGSETSNANNFLLSADSSINAWDKAISAWLSTPGNTVATESDGAGGTRTHEIMTKFIGVVSSLANDPSSVSLGEAVLLERTATNTLLAGGDTTSDWSTAITAYNNDPANAANQLSPSNEFLTALGSGDPLNLVAMAPSGQYLNSSNSLADWQAATSAYDAVNGTDISAKLPDEILTAIDSGNANAELSATAAILGENTNRLLSASDSLEDWKAAIEAFDTAQGTSTELSAVFTHPIASETDPLNSVTKQEEVPYQAGTEEVTIESNDTIKVNFGDLTADMAAVSDTNVQSQEDAQAVLAILDEGITTISKRRAAFGAAANRLEYAIDNLTNIQNNAEASRSRIMDTDYAETTSELAKAQIIAQAGTAMLAQANQLPQNILTLLK